MGRHRRPEKVAIMRMLVLGGNGFIGSHLVDGLLAAGHAVRVFDVRTNPFRQLTPNVECQLGSWEDEQALDRALADVDVAYHLIGTTRAASSNRDMVFDVQTNVIGSIRLLQRCVARGIKRIVFSSSGGTVYGIPRETPIPETHPTQPISSYGVTKVTVEKYLALYHHLLGLDYRIARSANPFGEWQPPRATQGAATVFMNRVAHNEPIEIWGDGSVVRDFIYIGDLVEAFVRLATTATEDRIFNLGAGQGTSLNELVTAIARVTHSTPQVIYRPGRKFDVPVNVLDISRARRQLDWQPRVSLEEGLARSWTWIQSIV